MSKINVEVLQTHPLQDIYRVKQGIILNVNKYKTFTQQLFNVGDSCVKLKGLKEGSMLLENVMDYVGNVIPKGTILIEYYPVIKSDEYFIELKIAGGTIGASFQEYYDLTDEIENILDQYNDWGSDKK